MRYAAPKTSVDLRGWLIAACVLGFPLGAFGLTYTSSHEERFSYTERDINNAVLVPYGFGGATVKSAVIRFTDKANGRFVIENGPLQYDISAEGSLTYSKGVVSFADPNVSVLEEAKVGNDLADQAASWAPEGWDWLDQGIRTVVSPASTFQGKTYRSGPMQAARMFPLLYVPGDHMELIERGSVEGVYAMPGGVEIKVTFWQMTWISITSLVVLLASIAIGAVLWFIPEFARQEL